jgi:hypothetical protein
MPIPLSCPCGRAFNIKDECGGHKIRCPLCKSVLSVPLPKKEDEPEEFDLEVIEDDESEEMELEVIEDDKPEEIELEVVEDEEEVLEVLPAEPQTRRSAIQATPSAKRPARLSSSADDERIQASRRRDKEDEPRPKRRPKLWREKARGPAIAFEEGRFGSTKAGIAGGMLMILIAVVWFVLGLAVNRIFIYPPILFVIGVIAIIKGLAGG